MLIVSIQVGKPRVHRAAGPVAPAGRLELRTGLYKDEVPGPVWVGREGLEGDGQANRRYHGGPDKAVCCFPGEHFAALAAYSGRRCVRHSVASMTNSRCASDSARPTISNPRCASDSVRRTDSSHSVATSWRGGAVGENLTLRGALEDDVCLGDRYRAGDALLEVSQPRGPCANLDFRWGAGLKKQMIQRNTTGWYCRVIQEGYVAAGEELILLDRPHPEWSIIALNQLMYNRRKAAEEQLRLAIALPELSQVWRTDFERRLI